MNRMRCDRLSACASNVDMQTARASSPEVASVSAVRRARYSALPVWLAYTTSQSAGAASSWVVAARARQMARHMAR